MKRQKEHAGDPVRPPAILRRAFMRPATETHALIAEKHSIASFRLDCTTHLCISFNKKEIRDFSYAKIVKH